jgi:D-alanyl-D-alanine carboxypeptidase (penicillin-binding protein 5/6)
MRVRVRPGLRAAGAAAAAALAGCAALAATAPPALAATAPPAPAATAAGPGAAQLAAAARAAGPAGVQAKAAAVADAGTGRLLWSRGLNAERPMGSITKVMTALVVIGAGHLDRTIAVPAAVTGYVDEHDASSAGLVPGDRLTAAQLLEALLLPSGADAAYALAVAYGPGIGAFVAKMNAAARRLGMTRTHFSNFDGLPWPTEYSTYSTAADLIRLGRAAMRSPAFRAIVGRRSYRVAAGHGHHSYLWVSTNPLLGAYPGAIGIKTGFTRAAGDCLLFEAARHGRAFIGVTLDSPGGFSVNGADATRILNWAFSLRDG